MPSSVAPVCNQLGRLRHRPCHNSVTERARHGPDVETRAPSPIDPIRTQAGEALEPSCGRPSITSAFFCQSVRKRGTRGCARLAHEAMSKNRWSAGLAHDERMLMREAPVGRKEVPSRPDPRTGAPSRAGRTRSVVSRRAIKFGVSVAVALGSVLAGCSDDDGDLPASASDGSGGVASNSGTTTSLGAVATTPSAPPTTAAVTRSGAPVMVANASRIKGSAAAMSEQLAAAGYAVTEPANSTGARAG